MKVFKFGGASVKNADGVRNVAHVLQQVGAENLVVVVSAMGKTTNALERVVQSYVDQSDRFSSLITEISQFHLEIVSELFPNKEAKIFDTIQHLFEDLRTSLDRNKSTNYDFIYDQIVSYGELVSTKIISAYLNEVGFHNSWIDARNCIKTNTDYRDAIVDWEITQQRIIDEIDTNTLSIIQGFIGADQNNFTTTLGREGSDYTAGIFAYCLNAESVSIWKDVPGVLNADPRVFDTTELLTHISYNEAIELAFFGASVIHPKTIQPLQRKEIPLYVKSFVNPLDEGTSVKKGQPLEPYIPCYIAKKNQILLSLSSLDFSFIVEENISEIFDLFHQYHIKVDLIQNSAISFSVCLDDKFKGFDQILPVLKAKFRVIFNKDVTLYTIRHYNQNAISSLEKGKEILLKQMTRETYQLVAKQ